jgi:hypothetical protein
VTGLQGALDAKAPLSHSHPFADVTGLQAALDAKAPTAHAHAFADVTGLQAALDAKQTIIDRVLAPTGTALLPALSFASEPTLGLWRSAAGIATLQGNLTVSVNLQVIGSTTLSTVSLNAGATLGAATNLIWLGRSVLNSSANGQLMFRDNGGTAGVGFDFATDAVLKIRTRAQTGDATLQALRVLSANGTAAIPALAAASDPTTGFFFGPAAGLIQVSMSGTASISFQAGSINASVGSGLRCSGTGAKLIFTAGDGQINLQNNANTAGVGFDAATDNVFKIRTRAQTAYATVDALGYRASGVAGVSFGPAAPTSITVVNGIVTACT